MSRRAARACRWTAAALLLYAAACAGASIKPEALPQQPIAVLHWEREDARRRAELLAGHRPGQPRREGVANVDDLLGLLGGPSRVETARELARYPGHLSLYEPTTGTLTRLAAARAGSRPIAWSRDHRRLLFASASPRGRYRLYEYMVDTQEVRSVTFGTETYLAGDYAPDGRIVFGGIELGGERPSGNLYVAEPGGGERRVITPGVLAESVRWSPGGEMLVFVIRRSGPTRRSPARPLILAQHFDDLENVRMLGAGRAPTFTPDGKWLVYSAPVAEGWKLKRMRLDGSARTSIGGSTRSELSPAVSPDGQYVAYVAEEGSFDRLFIRRMDGTGDRMLPGDGSFENPVW